MRNEEPIGYPSHVEPILAVNNILETVAYWHDVLGFPDKWTWGDPPNHGGVSWHGTSIQFSHNPGLAAVSKGNAIFINVKKPEALYNFHQKKNAVIIEPLENKPWGMAGYTVQDINGYYIVFAGALISVRKENSAQLPQSVNIIARSPTVKEYQYLTSSVGWSLYASDDVVTKLLSAPVFAAIAEDNVTNKIIGCGLVLSDNASFYYIKDLVVHPDWQAKHVGTALMKELTNWLEHNAANKALVGLITGENLAPFYQRFGFVPAFCMIRYIEQ
ncbi:MAG TPA: GNAT family N-acetyltransferase [Chitinophagaceae bacterium]|nr:GNAT family N-acetyltransferase [Chitinophagaceae bacterium]